MDKREKIFKRIGFTLVFIYLALYPFGQLLKFSIKIPSGFITLHLQDLVVGFSIPIVFLTKRRFPEAFSYIWGFLIAFIFSTILSFSFFSAEKVIVGSLYLIRLISYLIFSVLVWNLVRKDSFKKEKILELLLLTILCVAVFGWVQYLLVPDLRALKYIGWDDHLGRLVGTYFDPGFTASILLLGTVTASIFFMERNIKTFLFLEIIFLATMVVTYARSSYLSFLGVSAALFLIYPKVRTHLIFLIFLFFVLIMALPRVSGEGTRLERIESVKARFRDYKQVTEIIKRYPLFGVGFNNLCSARIKIFGGDLFSHSCSGSDSSLLFVTATTGIVGLSLFVYSWYQLFFRVSKDAFGKSVLVCFLGLLINSLFLNSLFYPWILGYMGILLGLGLRKESRG